MSENENHQNVGRHAAGTPADSGQNDMSDPITPVGPDLPGQPGGPGNPDTPVPDEPWPGGPGFPEPNPAEPTEPDLPNPEEPHLPSPDEPTAPTPPEVPGVPGAPDGPLPADESESDDRFVRGDGSAGDLSVLARDAAHPFDQTNGIIDRLDGDADDPDKVEERLNPTTRRGPLFPEASGAEEPSEGDDER